MSEYINMEDLETIYCRKGCAECKNEMCLDEMLRGLPTIDIVTCNECVYSEKLTDFCMVCELLYEWEDGAYKEVKPNWYCADGERSNDGK